MFSIKTTIVISLLLNLMGYTIKAENDISKRIMANMINKIQEMSTQQENLLSIVTQLQEKAIQQGKLIDILNSKITSLDSKEDILSYPKEITERSPHVNVINDTIEERISHLEELAKVRVLRTCEELHQHGVRMSGYYHIDPDGENIGFPPIRVYCNFENVATEIIHNLDNEFITIDHCTGGQCYEKEFIYTAPMNQIISLIQLSSSCSQMLVFDCFLAPLSYNDVQIGTWTDRFGQDQVYFTGASHGQHICSCFHNNSCTDQEQFHTKCNCDANIPIWMEDSGVITNMTALPITAFHYGPLEYETQEAKVKVGRLRCSGVVEVISPPESCNDLKKSGETISGLYPLHDGEHGQYPKLSYCDMSVAGYEGDMETPDGWMKFSSGPGDAVFSVQHRGHDDVPEGATITYDTTVVNKGNNMDISTGVFTAQQSGLFEFTFSGFTYPRGQADFRLDIYVNGNLYVEIFGAKGIYEELGRTWILQMESGDTVYLVLKMGHLHGHEFACEFTGRMI